MKLQFQANFIFSSKYIVFLYLSPTNDVSVSGTGLVYTNVLPDNMLNDSLHYGMLNSIKYRKGERKRIGKIKRIA